MTPKCIALFFVLVPIITCAHADEAITQNGQRFEGTLRKADFLVRASGKALSPPQLEFVRFPENSPPLPRCVPAHQLLFPLGQQLTGELLSVTANDVQFRAAGGDSYSVPRARLLGVVQ